MKVKLRNNPYLLYSITFLLLLLIIFLPFIKEGRTFVWNIDGINQHYPILVHYGELLRGLFLGRGFLMVDFRIGLGFDTITTLHYYGLGDPISILSIFMTRANAPIVYSLLILLRLYLIGISYIVFCRYWRWKGNGVVLGALIYVFCGYTFFSGVRHPYFLNPMIYLPLLLIGLEEVLRRKRPQLLIIMSFVCTISNFYFLYILTVMAIIYVTIRYVTTFHKKAKSKVGGFLLVGLRTGSYYLLGMSMAAVIFLPIIYAFLQNGRMNSKPELLTSLFHYNTSYYAYALQGFFASGISPPYWVDLSFVTITGFSIVIAFSNKRYHKLAITFLLSMLALFVPAFGYFMNAFTYITNRWDFLIAFIVAVVFTVTYEKLCHLNTREKLLIGVGITGYAVLAFVVPSDSIVKYSFFILLGTALLVLLLNKSSFAGRQRLYGVAIYLLVVGNIAFNGYVFYAKEFKGYSEQFLTVHEIREHTASGLPKFLSEMEEGWYRVETYGDRVRNEALIHNYNDVSFYYSLMSGDVAEFYKQMEVTSQRSAYRLENQDNRTILNALAGVRYFVSTDRYAAPYGYELKKTQVADARTYYLFENLFALPLGYIIHSYMTEEAFHKLGVLQKQNALLYSAVLKEGTGYVRETQQDMNSGIEELNYDIYVDDGIELRGDGFRVMKKNASMTLAFAGNKKSETYVRFSNLTINQRRPLMRTFQVKGEGEVSKRVNIRNKYHNTYFGKVDFLVNAGYGKKNKNWIRITFPETGTYGCDQIEVFSLSTKHIKQQLNQLRKEPMESVRVSNNRIEGEVTLSTKGILVLSIPYSKGWSARVDGEEVELTRANIMYSAIELPEGNHKIVLRYRTPYLLEGAILSTVGFIIFLGIIIFYHRKEATHG